MSVSVAVRSLLFKDVLSTPFVVNALQKRFSVFPPDSVKKFQEIPGPIPTPIIGNAWEYYLAKAGKYPFPDLHQVYAGYLKQYGPLVKEEVYFDHTLVHVFDPLDMQKIYCLDKTNPTSRWNYVALDEYRLRNNAPNGGLLGSNGETWAELRRTLGEDLFKNRNRAALGVVAEDFVNNIYKLIMFRSSRQVDLFPWLHYWALECIAAVVLGESFWVFRDHMILKPVEEFIGFIRKSRDMIFYTDNLPWIISRDCRQKLSDYQTAIYVFLSKPMSFVVLEGYKFDYVPSSITVEGAPICLKNSIAHDLVDRDLDYRDIFLFAYDCFHSGIHSPANVLAFALYHLARNPEKQSKVRKAIIEKNRNLKNKHKYAAEPVCEEITNVILETMRLNPPLVGTNRVLPEPLVLSGYNVPAGTKCILHHQIASKRPEHFENPEEFIPDRFNSPLSKKAMIANSPFGMGKRACPMKEMAMTELAYTLTGILSSFELSYNYESVGTKSGFMNEPDKNMRITFTPSRI